MQHVKNLCYRAVAAVLGLFLVAASSAAADPEKAVVVHFDTAEYHLTAPDKARISEFAKTVKSRPELVIKVEGHTDNRGSEAYNLKLGKKRADAVADAVLTQTGLSKDHVYAIGIGESRPVADNATASGRAGNRRAVIYIVKKEDLPVPVEKAPMKNGGKDKCSPEVLELLEIARAEIHNGHLNQAARLLKQAALSGADSCSFWYLEYGKLAFHGRMTPVSVAGGYFKEALALNPLSVEAREYLGRVSARAAFFDGRVHSGMGLSPLNAIPIDTESQREEYLALFMVRPLERKIAPGDPIQSVVCGLPGGKRVTYYFEMSKLYEWGLPDSNR